MYILGTSYDTSFAVTNIYHGLPIAHIPKEMLLDNEELSPANSNSVLQELQKELEELQKQLEELNVQRQSFLFLVGEDLSFEE